MKKLIISTCFLVLTLLCTSFIILPMVGNASAQKGHTDSQSNTPSYSYVIKDFNGNIAVFQKDKSRPFRVTDVKVDSLPLADKQMLTEGILVQSEEELKSIMEDYCS